jgi:ApbE superfamily uncharacterized protein (UPF0280 family)
MYQERFYRDWSPAKFRLEVCHKESDLFITTDKELDKILVQDILKNYYIEIEKYIKKNPNFLTSLSPLEQDENAPAIVKDMIDCSNVTGIGPFASIAGAIALYVGKDLLDKSSEIIIENGGDIFLKINGDKRVGVYLGERFQTNTVTLKVKKRDYPFGIASSSAYLGHSLNFGRADLVTVIAKDAILADGFATALSNQVKKEKDIKDIFQRAKENSFLEGLLIAFEGKLFLWGAMEIDG